MRPIATLCLSLVAAVSLCAQIPFLGGQAVDRRLRSLTPLGDSVVLGFGADSLVAHRAHVGVAFGTVAIAEARGWCESAYVEFLKFPFATSYNVYVKAPGDDRWTRLDPPLVRDYGDHGRADALGLRPARGYTMRVVPVDDRGAEIVSAAAVTDTLSVVAYDRDGYAHKGRTEGVGAYENDGTLKADAQVVYVTADNASTVSLQVNTDRGLETMTGLQAIINAWQKGRETRPLAVRLVGTIDRDDCDPLASSAEGLQIKGKSARWPMNITIEGVGRDACTRGFGFLLRNCSSVELRNFANMLCLDDAISIDTDNEHIWVHNLDLFYGRPGSASDQKKGDGTIDLKADSRLVTISHNHFWDTGKSSLCGMKSESGPNWITYHHNWFDHSDSRHPRIRTMSVHVYNNYFDGNSKYGVGAALHGNAFVDRNYFRSCRHPMLISRQGSDIASDPAGTFSGEDGGMIKAYGNIIDGRATYTPYQQDPQQFDAYEVQAPHEQVPSTVAAVQGGCTYSNFDTTPQLFYSYTPHPASAVPDVVRGWTGAGRMGHGDFLWTFDNDADDASSDVIEPLRQALTSYRSGLVGIFGADASGKPQPQDTTTVEPQPVEGVILCSFSKSGQPSSPLFAVEGNGSDSKGSVTVDGVTYTTCLKMETKTSVTFTLTAEMAMTLWFGPAETASVKIDGTKLQGATSNVCHVTLAPGTHQLTKDRSVNLFLIRLVPSSATSQAPIFHFQN